MTHLVYLCYINGNQTHLGVENLFFWTPYEDNGKLKDTV